MVSAGIRKWFELLGVVPLGVYLVIHLTAYARALFGATDFGIASSSSSAFLLLDVALVWLPLAAHALIGLWLSLGPLDAAPEERRRSLLLRASGWLSLVFLVQHTLWLRWPLLTGEVWPSDVGERMTGLLSSTRDGIPAAAAFHLLGLGVVTAHFGWGLARFLERWGILGARLARPISGWFCAFLFALGAATVVELATGSFVPRFLR
jgi:succinate dehydrogenase / fumarate reductase cytochrome b subunit